MTIETVRGDLTARKRAELDFAQVQRQINRRRSFPIEGEEGAVLSLLESKSMTCNKEKEKAEEEHWVPYNLNSCSFFLSV